MNTRRRKHVSLCEWGDRVTPRKNALMLRECLPREISVPGVCVSFFFPECSASSLAVPFCLQNQKRPGRPGGRSEAPIP